MISAFGAPREGAGERRVRVPVPAHDPLRAVHEERRVVANAVAERLPHAPHGLRIHKSDHDAGPVLLPRGANPLGESQELRLDVLGVLVDLLGVYLLADPRSLQERLAVGSVIEAGKHRRHDLDHNRLHVPSPATGWHAAEWRAFPDCQVTC